MHGAARDRKRGLGVVDKRNRNGWHAIFLFDGDRVMTRFPVKMDKQLVLSGNGFDFQCVGFGLRKPVAIRRLRFLQEIRRVHLDGRKRGLAVFIGFNVSTTVWHAASAYSVNSAPASGVPCSLRFKSRIGNGWTSL